MPPTSGSTKRKDTPSGGSSSSASSATKKTKKGKKSRITKKHQKGAASLVAEDVNHSINREEDQSDDEELSEKEEHYNNFKVSGQSKKDQTTDEEDEEDEDEDNDNDDDEGETFYFNLDQSSPSKRKSEEAMKSFQIYGNSVQLLTIELTKPGIELIYVRKATNGDDGYFNPVRVAINNKHAGVASFNLVTVASLCTGPDSDDAWLNTEIPPGKDKPFPRQCLVRVVKKSNKKSRRDVLNYLARFLNQADRNSPPRGVVDKQQWKNRQGDKYVVAEDFDKTPKISELRPLDHCLTSKAISSIIYHTMENVSSTWAQDNPELASAYFTPPYPPIACSNFGYIN